MKSSCQEVNQNFSVRVVISASEQLDHVLPSSSVDLENLQSAKPEVKQSKEDTSLDSLTRNDAKRRLFPKAKLALAVARKVRYTKAPPIALQNRREDQNILTIAVVLCVRKGMV